MVSSLTFDLLLDLRAQLQRQHLNEATETQQQSARRCARVTPCLHTRNHAAVSTFPFRSLPPHLALLIIELCLFQLLVHDVSNDELHLRQQSHHSRRAAGLRSAARRIVTSHRPEKLDRVCARDCASVTIVFAVHIEQARGTAAGRWSQQSAALSLRSSLLCGHAPVAARIAPPHAASCEMWAPISVTRRRDGSDGAAASAAARKGKGAMSTRRPSPRRAHISRPSFHPAPSFASCLALFAHLDHLSVVLIRIVSSVRHG